LSKFGTILNEVFNASCKETKFDTIYIYIYIYFTILDHQNMKIQVDKSAPFHLDKHVSHKVFGMLCCLWKF